LVRDDLNEIAAFIAKDSPRYAWAVISRLLEAGRSLAATTTARSSFTNTD
jgi:hypothetical protein